MLIAFLVRNQALMGSLNTLWYGSEQAWGHTELNYSHQRSPVMRLGADICAAMSLAAKLKKKKKKALTEQDQVCSAWQGSRQPAL